MFRLLKRRFGTGVRVRFAPSPTGHLHLGGLRTALYNYLFALSEGGEAILRIEDTDQTRKVEGAAEKLVKNLEWAGIQFREGPFVGGPHGPYVQSERIHIYQSEVKKLLDSGSAYKCFCSERRLNLLRRDALRNRTVPKYDNKCRHLSRQQVDEKIEKGESYCIRFKLSSDILTFDDLIYGTTAYDVSLTEGDPVILKADGFPTYHLANVVDDHYMKISHVLRGVEWQISTTKHLLMYKAFQWEPPHFGHLPLIINADGTKLSKRQGDIRVEDYQNKGMFPISVINYLTLAGGGFCRTPGEGVFLYSMEELVKMFQLNKINSSPSRLNPDLLDECNRLAIVENVKNDKELPLLISKLRNMVTSKYSGSRLDTSDDYIKSILAWASGRIKLLDELVSPEMAFLWILPSEELVLDPQSVEYLKKLYDKLINFNSSDFERSTIKEFLKVFTKENNVKFSNFMKLLRNVFGGPQEGPSVGEIMEVLGKENSLRRIQIFL